ncbi:MAG: hypothetical protein ACREBH_02370 [Candidatus Micrarchaeaceae archaeon]
MDPKVLVFIGFIVMSVAMIGIAAVLPTGILFVLPKLLLLVIAVIFDILAFASRYYSYLIMPFVRQRTRNVVINDQAPYWLSTTGDCIIRKVSDDYLATAYINIPIYVSSSEMNDEDRLRFAEQVSRLVGISREPVRFSTELYLMNKDDYIQKLKDNITNIENDQAKLIETNAPQAQLEHVRGKLSMWKKMLDNISSSVSFELGTFATISATGVKEFEAITMVQQKARELMNGIAANLGVPPNIITGSDILKYVEPEFLIPYSTITEQISRNIQNQVT